MVCPTERSASAAKRAPARHSCVATERCGRRTKTGSSLALLAAEITAVAGRDPGELYADLTSEFGEPAFDRVEAPATPEQKKRLATLSPKDVHCTELAGEQGDGHHQRGAWQPRADRRREGQSRRPAGSPLAHREPRTSTGSTPRVFAGKTRCRDRGRGADDRRRRPRAIARPVLAGPGFGCSGCSGWDCPPRTTAVLPNCRQYCLGSAPDSPTRSLTRIGERQTACACPCASRSRARAHHWPRGVPRRASRRVARPHGGSAETARGLEREPLQYCRQHRQYCERSRGTTPGRLGRVLARAEDLGRERGPDVVAWARMLPDVRLSMCALWIGRTRTNRLPISDKPRMRPRARRRSRSAPSCSRSSRHCIRCISRATSSCRSYSRSC